MAKSDKVGTWKSIKVTIFPVATDAIVAHERGGVVVVVPSIHIVLALASA